MECHWTKQRFIRSELENYKHYKADITSEKAVKNVFLSIRKEYKKVDFLINNAGMASMNHSLLTPKSTALNIMNTNFWELFGIAGSCESHD